MLRVEHTKSVIFFRKKKDAFKFDKKKKIEEKNMKKEQSWKYLALQLKVLRKQKITHNIKCPIVVNWKW